MPSTEMVSPLWAYLAMIMVSTTPIIEVRELRGSILELPMKIQRRLSDSRGGGINVRRKLIR